MFQLDKSDTDIKESQFLNHILISVALFEFQMAKLFKVFKDYIHKTYIHY